MYRNAPALSIAIWLGQSSTLPESMRVEAPVEMTILKMAPAVQSDK
jgi:hypothetical protein